MSYPPEINYDLDHLFWRPSLKVDGSNFVDWYQEIRGSLWVNKILYVIEEPLGDKPYTSASQEDKDAYRERRDTFITIQITMISCMDTKL